ncbi:FAD-dependent oxidoreductase [Streptomyces sp. P01-B04]|uniref:FAD-dependent oxidoreductase n=1 Tax=Streptomyces poriferorum TaxID=2798799 RepID=UPI001C5DFC90|nr:FAD-dependent oxidoreductase [Streptomyces poriferorum]MBW5249254.1 FAD-dependent oxidoreductase [Streptomyces poriferorum]
MTRRERTVDVLVVGAGPAGLGAAAGLAASGVRHVEVLEREQTAGGIPRHCHHAGFGSSRPSGASGVIVGTRAVIVGDEPVSIAAAATLRTAGVEVVARVTERPPALPASLAPRHAAPLLTRTTVTALTGRGRLAGVTVRHRDGRTTTLPCDTVVFTGDWIPDHELARRGDVPLDPGTRGPAYDAAYRTHAPGVFAAGNLLHAVESAGTAAAEGRALAAPVRRPDGAQKSPTVELPPVLTDHELVVRQDGRELYRRRLLRPVRPGRPFHLPADWLGRADPHGGTVCVSAG